MMCALVALTACGTGVKQSVRTPVEMGERIELKTPDPKMGLTINEALAARSSSRDFSPEMLSLEELSGVLWAAAGVNREDGHLTAPSAMALYPIRVYAFLPEGVYRYDSKANVLNRVIEGDRRELTAMQDFAYTAPLNLVYVADYSVYADRNQPVDRIRFWCAADAGGYTENVNLYAAGNGLKAHYTGQLQGRGAVGVAGARSRTIRCDSRPDGWSVVFSERVSTRSSRKRVAPRCVLSGAGRLQVRYRVDFSDEPCYRRFFLTNERGISLSLTSFWILRLGKTQ